MGRARTGLIPLLAVAASAAPAQAGTISIAKGPEGVSRENGFWVTYAATGGIANDVTASWDEAAQTMTITDRGEPIVPLVIDSFLGPNAWPLTMCTYTANTAVCRAFPQHSGAHLDLRLNGGDDRARVDPGGASTQLHGGAGDDRLETTGGGWASLHPGDGDDAVVGGPADDMVWPSRGADRLSGGGGRDTVHYRPAFAEYGEDTTQNPVTGVRITPDGVADDGQPGEADNVLGGFEVLEGSWFDDAILGGPAGETIDGGLGSDRLEGGGGDDRLEARDGWPDVFSCGAGVDLLRGDAHDAPAAGTEGDCEAVNL